MRYVEFSQKADAFRTRLHARIRLPLGRAIIRIVRNPKPGSADQVGPRYIAGDGVNTGLIVEIVQAGGHHFAITYRIRSAEDLVWIEDLREVFIG